MKLFSITSLASLFLTLSAQAESLSCISRDQPLGRGYEISVRNESFLDVSLRGRTVLSKEAVRKVSTPTAGGQFRTDYVSARARLVVSSKGVDQGYYSMLSIRGLQTPVLLYCTRY
jgi:hypothetical protein